MQSLSDLFSSNGVFNIPDLDVFLIDTVILLFITQLLAFIYRKFGQTLSNRKKLSSLFPLLALTTMMIITVIKSSIALSLGLVGALSIVRFRSAIKEPEELAYIFLTISLGLGMGAGQRNMTIAFFLIAGLFLLGRALLRNKIKLPGFQDAEKVYIEVRTNPKISLEKIVGEITPLTSGLELKRMDQGEKKNEYYFLAYVQNFEKLTQITNAISKVDHSAEISVLNEETLFS